MSANLIYKCPRCNGLFEVADYGEHGAVCKWCGNEIGIEETVEIGDDKKLLSDILNNREELESGAGIPTGKLNYILVALCCVPFLYAFYYSIAGEPVRWYMYIFMFISIFLFFGMYIGWKESRVYYRKLKELIISHNYSLVSLSSEIAILKGWGKNVEAVQERLFQDSYADKKIYRCSACKSLYEDSDHGDTAVCPHCGQIANESELVQIGNDRKAILDILNDRQELDERIGISYPSKLVIAITLVPLLPFLWFFHHIIVGDPIRWYLLLFMLLGAIISLFFYKVLIVGGNACYMELKKIAEKHDYSIIDMSTEIAEFRAKADNGEDEELDSIVAKCQKGGYPLFVLKILCIWHSLGFVSWDDMAKYLDKLVDYVLMRKYVSSIYNGIDQEKMQRIVEQLVNYLLSKSIVREEYSRSERVGISVDNTGKDEVFIYIVPPSQCPGCNHIYTSQELNNDTVICPNCSTEIQLVDKAIRSQVQQKVKDFLVFSMKSYGRKIAKGMLFGWGAIVCFCLILMAFLGVMDFYCSIWAFIWFMACVSIMIGIQSNIVFIQLYRMSKKGVYDLTELELMIENRAAVMLPEFYKFKAELVKQLEK